MTGKNLAIATAVASLFATSNAMAKGKTHGKKAATVHCAGINTCSGKGSCAGADNTCKAQNTCKGKGWVETSAKDCKAKGGTVAANMPKKADKMDEKKAE